jgi:alpha-N-arabinofuranosidase
VPITSDTGFGPAYWVAGTSSAGNYTFKAAIYNSTEAVPFSLQFEGLEAGVVATLTVLTAPDGLSSNVFAGSDVVIRNVMTLTSGPTGFEFELENYSVAVLTT